MKLTTEYIMRQIYRYFKYYRFDVYMSPNCLIRQQILLKRYH